MQLMQFREWAAWAINTINTTMRLRVDFDIMNQISKDSRVIKDPTAGGIGDEEQEK